MLVRILFKTPFILVSGYWIIKKKLLAVTFFWRVGFCFFLFLFIHFIALDCHMESPLEGTLSLYDSQSFASTYRSTKNATKTTEELKNARENRAAEAFRMKDEQLKILSEQNSSLLASLDKVEEESNSIQLEKLAVEQENRTLRDNNFDLQSRTRAAETMTKKLLLEGEDKDKQLRIMTDQNAELLRLLESEESLTVQHQKEISELKATLDEVTQKYGSLLGTAKTHEEIAVRAAKEGQLRVDEIRILRTETEQLKQSNSELKMKTQVEVESLQEQLRVRKEKQYQLLEKLQAQEQAKRQAEDLVAGMEDQLRTLHAKKVEQEALIQAESRAKLCLVDAQKQLQVENTSLSSVKGELQAKIERSETERLRMEAEARDNGEQLREMAEKVFQLLERLKLAELGKTKSLEALKKKEQDMVSLQKKNSRLIKECADEGRSKVKAELDVKVLTEQVRSLKKHNQTVAQQSKEEAAEKLKSLEECEQLTEKLRIMESRLSFLLNKVQLDDESRVVEVEDRRKLEAQVLSLSQKCEELMHKLHESTESNRVMTHSLRLKQEELSALLIKHSALTRELEVKAESEAEVVDEGDRRGPRPGGPDSIENVRNNDGRGRFYVDIKVMNGGNILLLKGRKVLYKEWMDRRGVNDFLKRAQGSGKFKDLIVERLACVYGLLMVEEEARSNLEDELNALKESVHLHARKLTYLQELLSTEEDAKRRMLLRYLHTTKEFSTLAISNGGEGGSVQMPESNISDEEVHALSALLKSNTSIRELNLRGNNISDDGARSLCTILSGRSALRSVDLRNNRIGKGAIKLLAEALERSERVKHVYVHAGGKIEAIGVALRNEHGETSASGESLDAAAVETICVVDIRENDPDRPVVDSDSVELHLLKLGESSPSGFDPRQLLAPQNGGRKVANAVRTIHAEENRSGMVFLSKSSPEKVFRESKDTSALDATPLTDADKKKLKLRVIKLPLLI